MKDSEAVQTTLKMITITNSEFRAPTDCVQYFTGLTGSVANYGHGSGDLLINQEYNMCIRTEVGHISYLSILIHHRKITPERL